MQRETGDRELPTKPNSAVNLELLFHTLGKGRGVKEFLAEKLGCHPSKISRLQKDQELAQAEALVVAKAFEFASYGLSESALFGTPSQFGLELRRAGFGMYRGFKNALRQMEDMPMIPGRFVPEALMELLARTDSHRGLGSGSREARDVPSASGKIRERFGLAVEVEVTAVADAIRRGEGHAIFIHVERDTGHATLYESRDGHAVRPLSWLFTPPREPDEGDFESDPQVTPPVIALLTNSEESGGRIRHGYQIDGPPGLRDIYLFLFSERPKPKDGWLRVKDGHEVTPDIAKSLVNVAVVFGRAAKSQVGHVVYEALSG